MSISDYESFSEAWRDIQIFLKPPTESVLTRVKCLHSYADVFKTPRCIKQEIDFWKKVKVKNEVDEKVVLELLESDEDVESPVKIENGTRRNVENKPTVLKSQLLESDEDVESSINIEDGTHRTVEENKPTVLKSQKSKIRKESDQLKYKKSKIRKESDQLKYKCETCGMAFKKRSQRNRHRFENHLPPRFVCDICGLKTPTNAKLVIHKKTHEERPCKLCSNKYSTYSELRRHMAVDHVKIVNCSECDQSFRHKRLLRRHMRIHGKGPDRIPCPYEDCPRSYSNKSNMTNHVKTYHEGQRFPCTVDGCTFILSTKQKLSNHIRLHSLSRVLPTNSRTPRDDSAIKRRKLREAEEARLRQQAKVQEQIRKTPWWERSSEAESSCAVESDNSLSRFLLNRKRRQKRRRNDSEPFTTDESGLDVSSLNQSSHNDQLTTKS